MSRLSALLAVPLALGLVLTACGDDGADTTEPADTEAPAETEPAEDPGDGAAGTTYDIALSGDAVPDGGDEDGTGEATLTLDPDAGEVCFQVSVDNVEPVEAMHIHEGATGEAGPVFIGLEALEGGVVDSCVEAEGGDVQQVVDDPAGYYLNLHNAEFPDGALRGQLG